MNRIASAIRAIFATIIKLITLPFRVVARLLGGGRRERRAPR